MMSGRSSGTTIWCVRCSGPSCGPGARLRERALQQRAGEWFEAAGDTRRATRHFLAARQADRALALLQDRVVPDFLRDPIAPSPLDMSMVDPGLLADAPERMLGLAADLLLSGDVARGGGYLDAIERAQPPIPPGSTAGRPVRTDAGVPVRAGGPADRGGDRGAQRPGHPAAGPAQRRVASGRSR